MLHLCCLQYCGYCLVYSLSLSLSLSLYLPPLSSVSATIYPTYMQLPTMQYNLHLLKAMLECNSTAEGKVDQPTYSHIIRMWVKDVRDRSEKAAAPEPTLEVHVCLHVQCTYTSASSPGPFPAFQLMPGEDATYTVSCLHIHVALFAYSS